MNWSDTHDDLLLNLLKEKGQIIPFLDTIFGFLYRRTDFYVVQENPNGKIGFPPGLAEKAVRDTFRKWQKLTLPHGENLSHVESDMTDLVIHEEEVETTDQEVIEPSRLEEVVTQDAALQSTRGCVEKSYRQDDLSSDTYNGADCGTYRWAQTRLDIDVKVPVPSSITKSNDVQVNIQACQLSVSVRDSSGEWATLLSGELSQRHLKEESIWTLLPGKQITLHLQKVDEKWWDRLLTTETKLDLTRLDVTRHLTDLPEEDHMQVERVLAQEERKRLGLVSSEHQEKLDLLKKAWNVEGSPFQGTPFDPTVLQLPP